MAVSTDRRQGVNSSAAVKVPCRVATTANITLSGLQSIDGVTVMADDRVLVKNQTTASENGIYNASSSTWTRAPDCDGTFDLKKGTLIRVNSGTTNGAAWFAVTTDDPITIGTTSLAFSATATTPFASSLVSFLSTATGAVARTVQDRLDDTVHLSDFLGSGTYTQAWQAAVASGVASLSVDLSGTITAQIDIPTSMIVYGNGYVVTKGFNGDMFTLAGSVIVHDLFLQGAGATFTGRGFVISASADQKILDCGANDMNGYCLEFTANDCGSRFELRGGGRTWQRTNAETEAIKLPALDSPTVGGRTFLDVYAGGGKLIDLSGGNVSYIIGCNGRVTFGTDTKATILLGNRLGATTIKGSNQIVYGNEIGSDVVIDNPTNGCIFEGNIIAGNVTINDGTSNVRYGDANYASGTVTTNATATTNRIFVEADVTPTWGGNSSNPAIGNGTMTCRATRTGKHIRAVINVTMGSTTTYGSGSWFFQMPTAWNMNVKAGTTGSVRALDNGTAVRVGVCYTDSGAAPKIYMTSDGGTVDWNVTVPHTWASTDTLRLEIEWEIG